MFSILSTKQQESSAATTPLFSVAEANAAGRAKRWLKDRIERSKKGVFTEEVELTPILAELLLAEDVNADNRAIKWKKLEHFVGQIERGEWELNGETVKVSRDGKLNDGQHRCVAVCRAGRPIRTLMVFGVERDSRRTVDTGSARGLSDVLGMKGEKNAASLAAAVRMLWLYENGKLPAIDSPSHTQGEELLNDNPGLRDSYSAADKIYRSLRGSKGTWQFCHYVCSLIDREGADEVFAALATGTELRARDPIYRLREHLLAGARDRRIMNTWQQAALTLKLWNMKRGLERPGLPAYDPATEAFPVAR